MTYQPLVFRSALFLSFLTVILLAAGALVTGTGSGLAVPDWPLSYGQFFPPMVGGIFFEHGHRMIAGTVGIVTVIVAFLVWKNESRLGVKLLSAGMVLLVVFQAVLGGITVLFRLPMIVSVTHACTAQLFFSSTVVLSVVTSKWWQKPSQPLFEKAGVSLLSLSILGNFLFFAQLVLGATVRHSGSGLAIPDFPLVFGGIFPKEMTFGIMVHYFHRVGAFTVMAFSFLMAFRVLKSCSDNFPLLLFSGAMAALVSFQFMLGAMVIWLKRPVPLTTVHLVVGALCFASSFALTASIRRCQRVPVSFPAFLLPNFRSRLELGS